MKQLLADSGALTRVLVIVALLGLLALLLFTVHVLLVPLVAAGFLAYLLEPPIEMLEKRGLSRGGGYLLVLSVGVLGLAILAAFAPQWMRPERFAGSGRSSAERIQQAIGDVDHWMAARVPMVSSINMADKITTKTADFATHIFEELPSIVGSFAVNLLLVPFIAYFMIRDGRRMRRRIVDLVPNRYFEMTLMMFYRIDQQIGGYLRGRLIECSLVALTQMIAMGIVSRFVPLNQILLISAVCGATNIIPYVGPVLGVAFGSLLYLGAGLPLESIYALVAVALAAHLIDNVAIAPAVLSHNVDLHPLTVALVLVIGGEMLGVLGLLIAVPLAASLKVIAQEVYSNYQLRVGA